MKILLALKQVPAADSEIRVRADGRWVDESGITWQTNEPDAYALEAGLELRARHGGELIVLCAGPERARTAIRRALARGADRAIHIEADDLESYCTLGLGRLLAAAAAAEAPDLILTGLQSDDLGGGQTGVVMAELLGVPHATIIMAVEIDGGMVRVKRELEGGLFQYVTMPLPAVLTIQSGINKLGYETLMGIKKARTKEVRVVTAAELGVAGGETVRLERVSPPRRTKRTQMLTGTPAEQAAQLVDRLRREARVL